MAQQGNTYVVEGGDNLFSIAEKVYGEVLGKIGAQRMFADIMALNKLKSGVIRPGMVLTLPAPRRPEQISISQGLMDTIKAENKFVQETGKMPTPAELQAALQKQAGFVQKTPEQLRAETAAYQTYRAGERQTPPTLPSTYTAEEIAAAKKAYGERYREPLQMQTPYSKDFGKYKYQEPVLPQTRGEAINVGLSKAGQAVWDVLGSDTVAGYTQAGLVGASAGSIGGPYGVLGGTGIGLLTHAGAEAVGGIQRWLEEPINQPAPPLPPPQVRRGGGSWMPAAPPAPQAVPYTQAKSSVIPELANTPLSTEADLVAFSQQEIELSPAAVTTVTKLANAQQGLSYLTPTEITEIKTTLNIVPNSPLDTLISSYIDPSLVVSSIPSIDQELQNISYYVTQHSMYNPISVMEMLRSNNSQTRSNNAQTGGIVKTIGTGSGAIWSGQ